MDSSNSIADVISKNSVFTSCPPQSLARFLPHVSELTLEVGGSLQHAGERANDTFFVISGKLEIHTGSDRPENEERRNNLSGYVEHGFLGEEAAIGMHTYVATATAAERTKVLVIPGSAMWELAKYRPLREALLTSFSARFGKAGSRNDSPNQGTTSPNKAATALSPRELVGWIMALVAPISVIYGLQDSASIPSLQALYLLGIISTTIVMWVFRLMPDFVPALFSVLCVAMLGIAPPEVTFSGFASNTFFMALSIFGLSALIIVSGLSFRILLWLLRVGPPHKAWYYLSLFLSGMVLTPIVPTSNGRTSIVTPFMNDLLDNFDEKTAKAEAPRLSAAVLGGTSLLSAIFLSSKSVNFLVFGMLPFQEQARFQWLDWLFATSVCGAVLLVLYFTACWVLFRNKTQPSIPKTQIYAQLKILGPMNAPEWAGVVGLSILMVSFITASTHHIDIPWIALAILFSLLMFGFLEKVDFRNKIDWSFLVFLGGLIGMVASMKYVKLDIWVTGQLSWLSGFMANDFNLFIAVLSATIFFVRLALPINATVVIFATLLIPTAVTLGVNPWLVGFIVLLMSETFIWPYQASYYSQFCSIAGKNAYPEDIRLIGINALVFFIKLAAIYISIPYWKMLGLL